MDLKIPVVHNVERMVRFLSKESLFDGLDSFFRMDHDSSVTATCYSYMAAIAQKDGDFEKASRYICLGENYRQMYFGPFRSH